MTTPPATPADVQAADLAQAGHDIRLLLASAPERLLWVPGRARWGLALLQESDRVIVSIDGCLAIAMTCWPSHFVPGGVYPLDAVVRCVKRGVPIKRLAGHSLFACRLPQAVTGECCVIITHQELGWMIRDDPSLEPLEDAGRWTAPSDLAAVAAPCELHPWLGIAALRPPEDSPERFVSAIGEPLESLLLPDAWRAERLRCHWQLHQRHERERARLAGHALPAWLEDDHGCDHLVEAWLSGWRGPSPPVMGLAEPRPAAPLLAGNPGLPGTAEKVEGASTGTSDETSSGPSSGPSNGILPTAATPLAGPSVSWR